MTGLRSLAIALLVVAAVFATAIFHGRVLAVGDGLIEAVPGFFAPFARWQPDMFGGFPIYADPSKAFWYPLRLLHFLPGGFNAYVVVAYAVAAWATYGYVRNTTGSTAAGVASASAFAFGGFLISQLGHPMIVEPACWFCVAIWSLDTYLRSHQRRWLLTLAASLLLCLTAGQPQVAVFSITLLLGYLLFVGFDGSLRGTARVYLEGLLAIVLGVAGAALAWLPTLALSAQSVRSGLDFASFVLDSLPPDRIALMLIYPFAGGGGAQSIYHGALVSGSNFVETANYVPLGALILAPLASFSGKRRLAIYWTAVAVIALALAVGDALPLAALTFQIPGFNLLRIPGRHAFEFTFAVAILAGLGVAAIGRRIHSPIAVGCAVVLGLLLVTVATLNLTTQDATFVRAPSVAIFAAAAAVQVVFVLTAATLRNPAWRSGLACCAVVTGAALFGTTAYWQDAPDARVLAPPAYAKLLQRLPLSAGQRVYTEGDDAHLELEPNLPNIWGVPEFGGYTPLQYAASRIFLQTGENGRLLNVNSSLVDAAAVRYFVTPAQPDAEIAASARFGNWDLGYFLSVGRANAPRSLTLGLRRPHAANRIAIVTALGASAAVRQGSDVATVIVRGRSGATQQILLRAGVETAEFAYDRPDVFATVRHRKAEIYERNGYLNWYVSELPLRLHEPVGSVTITVIDPAAALNVRRVSLIDEPSGRAYPFAADAAYYGDPGHFRHVGDVAGSALFENRRSGPAVWIARAMPLPLPFNAASDDALAALRERLMRLDLRHNAMVEGAVAMPPAQGSALVARDAPERRDVVASCRGNCLLVSSMTFSDDWKVAVDGHPGALLRVDGFLQGVVVPDGRHAISFRYAPAAGRNGLLISGASIATLVSFLWWRRRVRPGAVARAR